MTLRAPEPISSAHDVSAFECGHAALDDFLRRRASKNEAQGASRTFVVCDDTRVVGYYTIAAGSVEHARAPSRIRRNMPEPIPAVVLGRLAVDLSWQSRGIGRGLLKDAVLRATQVRVHMGARVMLCHAIDERARAFYLQHGFVASPLDELTVMLDLARLPYPA